MRKFLISLLVASALTPAAALAQDRGPDHGDRSHDERNSQSDDKSADRPQRAERSERPAHVERAESSGGAERAVRVERPATIENVKRPIKAERPATIDRVERPVRIERQVHSDQLATQVRVVNREPQEEEQQGQVVVHHGDGDRTDSHHRWSGDWRHDHRYDWHSHRSRYGSLYRLGRYYDPYGWGYRRFSIGFNLWPSYYGSNFWMNDPWQYRLPPAYGPYRWVRYFDDALLVNIYTGQVVDVVYNFFW